MAKVKVTVSMDEDLKAQAEELFSDFGLDFEAAFNLFAEQAVKAQRIPLEASKGGVTIASESALKTASAKLIDKNLEAYKELAK